MSIFNAAVCKLSGDAFVGCLAWSSSDAIAAVSTITVDDSDKECFQVQFINIEGEVIPNASISHDCEAVALDWQPNGRVIGIGWADGMVSCWMVDGRNRPTPVYSNSQQHYAQITILKWNPLGKRVITGDKKGQLCVWTVDPRGALSPTRQYNKKGEISSAAFCIMPIKGDVARKGELKQSSYSPSFFFGTDRGSVAYADDLGHCTDVQQLSSSIDTMLFYEERCRLVIITRSLLLTQYQVAEDGKVTRVMQVKLSVAGDVAEKGLKFVVWASPGLVAAATQEKLVRLLDLGADESYNLSLSVIGDIVDRTDRVISVAFGPLDRYLAVGTQGGVIAVWKFNGPLRDVKGSRSTVPPTAASDWELHYATHLPTPIHQLSWHGGQGTLGVVTDEGAVILTETVMQAGIAGDISVLQTSSTEVSVSIEGSAEQLLERTGLLIKGLSVGRSCFAAWGGKSARVFRVDSHSRRVEPLDPFPSAAKAMLIADANSVAEESLFVVEHGIVKVCNYQGTQKGSITFSELEGMPEHIDINGKFLAVVTNKGVIKILDVTNPTKAKQLGSSGHFKDSRAADIASAGDAASLSNLQVRCIKVNADGTRVAVLADRVEGVLQIRHPDSRLHVYDRNRGGLNTFDFATLKRRPVGIFWDESDDRMLACEALKNRVLAPPVMAGQAAVEGGPAASKAVDEPSNSDAAMAEMNEIEVVIFFATTDNGLLMQDSFARKPPFGNMFGFVIPRLYFRDAPVKKRDDDDDSRGSRAVDRTDGRPKIYSKVMRDFIGMKDVDEKVKFALLDFSYNLTLGKLDEAYKAVKAIDSPSIWENMAQMCVKTKRLDVAQVCLGHMGHARGAAAVRESAKYNSVEASVGVLAVQLGLLDDAVRLFRDSNHPELLNRLYQAAGVWDKAVAVASTSDRLHLKNTFYQYAKHLESIGDVQGAVENYEKSDTSRTEVPRMLFSQGRIEELEDYVTKSEDTALTKWWAAYQESNERYDNAGKYYKKAGDHLSLVRIACFKNDPARAADIVKGSGDRAAAYHLARQLEAQGEYQEAIDYYALSGCYNHSIRLARANNLDSELMKFALKSSSSLMLDCAQHFESKGDLENAVQLYHKGGDLPRALSLCFKVGESKPSKSSAVFDMVNAIVQDLGAETSPQTLAKCAQFLVTHKQFDKAIELYVMARKYTDAIEMCLTHKVSMSEAMVERLSPPESMDAAEKKELLTNVAKALKRQGAYLLASKKYTQAGDRVRAIKCLVRSGDTKAVIQFATISRTAEIYTLAANYLQQMNWRESVDIMKSIITFYTKAKAYEQLAGFYDSCAQVEIDEYRDYEKATGALREAMKHLSKAPASRQVDNLTASLEKKIALIEKFVQARRAAQREPDTMVAICEALLQEPLLEEAVRAGDCLAMLVEHFHGRNRMKEAFAYLQEMEARRIPINPYIDAEVLEQVYKAAGVPMNRGQTHSGGAKQAAVGSKSPDYKTLMEQGDDDDVVDEDIGEELEESEDYSRLQVKKPAGGNRPKSGMGRK